MPPLQMINTQGPIQSSHVAQREPSRSLSFTVTHQFLSVIRDSISMQVASGTGRIDVDSLGTLWRGTQRAVHYRIHHLIMRQWQ